MKRAIIAAVVFSIAAVGADYVDAKGKSVTGTLDWPHGDPIKLAGAFTDNQLTFAGDSGGENFSMHVDATGTLRLDDTMGGTLRVHFVDFNDAHQVAREHDQEIPWTAARGEHGIVHFPR